MASSMSNLIEKKLAEGIAVMHAVAADAALLACLNEAAQRTAACVEGRP